MVAEAVAIFIHAVDPQADTFGQGLVDISGEAKAAVAVACPNDFAVLVQARLLGDPVDDAAAAATAEDHGVRALQHLDPLNIVEVAEILDVIAQSVDEEIGGAAVAAQNDLVAVALAGASRSSRHEVEHVGDGPQLLILDLAF